MKECPECVIEAGAALVVLRHLLDGQEGIEKLGITKFGFGSQEWYSAVAGVTDEARDRIRKAIAHFTPPPGTEYTPGMIRGYAWGRAKAKFEAAVWAVKNHETPLAQAMMEEAHANFAAVLDAHGIEQPTNKQLAGRMVRGIISPQNWR